MNIFFAGSVRGGRSRQPQYSKIVEELQKYGNVISGHVSHDALSEFGETELDMTEMRTRELEALSVADVVVAEVSTPSLGVGYLLSRATEAGKRTIALYDGENTLTLSGMVVGDPQIEIHTYGSAKDIPHTLKTAFTLKN